jgi:hypothetical protein
VSALNRGRPVRYLSQPEREQRDRDAKARLEQSATELAERLRAEAPRRTQASKPELLENLDALQVALDNTRGALEAAHVFDVRAVGDNLRAALAELDRAEARIVNESDLDVREG